MRKEGSGNAAAITVPFLDSFFVVAAVVVAAVRGWAVQTDPKTDSKQAAVGFRPGWVFVAEPAVAAG